MLSVKTMSSNQRVAIKYISKKTGKIKKIEYPNESFDYIISTAGRWVNVIANERIEVKAGQPAVIKIYPVELHPKEITLTCPVSRHALGMLLGLYGSEGRPQLVENKRVYDKAVFLALREGVIEEGDLLGVMNVIIVYEVLEKHLVRTCFSPAVSR